MHNYSTFGARMGHMHIHKTHHSMDLREATTFLLIAFSITNHGGCTQMSFCNQKEGNAQKTPTGNRLTSLDSITYTPSHELPAVSLTCYNSRITV